MPRLKEEVFAAVYEDKDGEFILLGTISQTAKGADILDAQYRKYIHDPKHSEYQRISRFRIEEHAMDIQEE